MGRITTNIRNLRDNHLDKKHCAPATILFEDSFVLPMHHFQDVSPSIGTGEVCSNDENMQELKYSGNNEQVAKWHIYTKRGMEVWRRWQETCLDFKTKPYQRTLNPGFWPIVNLVDIHASL